jgi:hypothetical protein
MIIVDEYTIDATYRWNPTPVRFGISRKYVGNQHATSRWYRSNCFFYENYFVILLLPNNRNDSYTKAYGDSEAGHDDRLVAISQGWIFLQASKQ